jgi:hypothetical protein
MPEAKRQLLTLKEYRGLEPFMQGYACYMQAELPGSELRAHQRNPYPKVSKKHEEWNRGQLQAMIIAQDTETD